jgi:sialic acid synthase SpsE
MSVDPEELAEMVAACDRGAALRGEAWIGVRPSEEPARASARRSIVLERDVEPGAELAAADLGYKRPGSGIPPFEADQVIGRHLRDGGSRGKILAPEDLE